MTTPDQSTGYNPDVNTPPVEKVDTPSQPDDVARKAEAKQTDIQDFMTGWRTALNQARQEGRNLTEAGVEHVATQFAELQAIVRQQQEQLVGLMLLLVQKEVAAPDEIIGATARVEANSAVPTPDATNEPDLDDTAMPPTAEPTDSDADAIAVEPDEPEEPTPPIQVEEHIPYLDVADADHATSAASVDYTPLVEAAAEPARVEETIDAQDSMPDTPAPGNDSAAASADTDDLPDIEDDEPQATAGKMQIPESVLQYLADEKAKRDRASASADTDDLPDIEDDEPQATARPDGETADTGRRGQLKRSLNSLFAPVIANRFARRLVDNATKGLHGFDDGAATDQPATPKSEPVTPNPDVLPFDDVKPNEPRDKGEKPKKVHPLDRPTDQ